MNLGTVIPTTGTFVSGDLSSVPYVVAAFSDVTGGVQLDISCPGLGFAGSGSYEHIGTNAGHDGLLLNVTDTQVGHLTFAVTGTTIGSTSSSLHPMPGGASIATFAVTQGLNAYDAAPGQKFDINIPFAEKDILTEFGNGKSITYLITSTVAGLSSADFARKDSNGTYYAAAAIDDATGKLFVATSGQTSSVPDAGSTAALLALALLGLGGAGRKFSKA